MKKFFSRFARNKKGTVAVEFAFIAPVMITLFFGTLEACNALICDEKVTTVASTAADLVAQDSGISTSQVNDVFAALNSILFPNDAKFAKIKITSIINDINGKPVVAWSVAQNDNPYAVGTKMTVPAGLITAGGSVIYAEIKYAYSSPTTFIFTKSITMQDSFYARPRKSLQVAGPGT